MMKKQIWFILYTLSIFNIQGCTQKEEVPLYILNKEELLSIADKKAYEDMIISELNRIRAAKGFKLLNKKSFKDLIYYKTLEKNGIRSVALYMRGRNCNEDL